eukprot:358610-Chlamydomonas_euryale.AAC.3
MDRSGTHSSMDDGSVRHTAAWMDRSGTHSSMVDLLARSAVRAMVAGGGGDDDGGGGGGGDGDGDGGGGGGDDDGGGGGGGHESGGGGGHGGAGGGGGSSQWLFCELSRCSKYCRDGLPPRVHAFHDAHASERRIASRGRLAATQDVPMAAEIEERELHVEASESYISVRPWVSDLVACWVRPRLAGPLLP